MPPTETLDSYLHICEAARPGTMAGKLVPSIEQIPHAVFLGVPEFFSNFSGAISNGNILGGLQVPPPSFPATSL